MSSTDTKKSSSAICVLHMNLALSLRLSMKTICGIVSGVLPFGLFRGQKINKGRCYLPGVRNGCAKLQRQYTELAVLPRRRCKMTLAEIYSADGAPKPT